MRCFALRERWELQLFPEMFKGIRDWTSHYPSPMQIQEGFMGNCSLCPYDFPIPPVEKQNETKSYHLRHIMFYLTISVLFISINNQPGI